jgi:hypothetical protein
MRIEPPQYVVGLLVPVIARRRQAHFPGSVAVDELGAEQFFQLGQVLRDGWLRQADPLRRLGDRSGDHDGLEDFELLGGDFHDDDTT